MKIESNRKLMVTFSAISLTDIVLLLLIFFMLTSSFVVQPGIKVRLPRAATGQEATEDRVFITVTSSNQIYLNQVQVNRSQLGEQLRQILRESDRLVVIRADKDISLESTIRIVDIAKLAGAERFMIATEQAL
ncbi:MAG TPA: biopolymer transporter ExbD [bacterium]|nr:biopolymer transporter ExbD [bacterium]